MESDDTTAPKFDVTFSVNGIMAPYVNELVKLLVDQLPYKPGEPMPSFSVDIYEVEEDEKPLTASEAFEKMRSSKFLPRANYSRL